MKMLALSFTILYSIICNFPTVNSFGLGVKVSSAPSTWMINIIQKDDSSPGRRRSISIFVSPLHSSLSDDYEASDDEESKEEITQSKLESILQNSKSGSSSSSSAKRSNLNNIDERLRQATEEEIEAAERIAGNVNVPKTGISINDEMTSIQSQEKFLTRLFPLDVDEFRHNVDDNNVDENNNGEDKIETQLCTNNVAAIQTVTAETDGDEPMRYIVAYDRYTKNEPNRKYAMIDIPPYSDDLVDQINTFMTVTTTNSDTNERQMTKGTLSTILVTCKNGLHYDEEPAVYVTRRSDLVKWKKAFPNVDIVMYRLDTPRDCKESLSQVLDGYGPWALNDGKISKTKNEENNDALFLESGRPLTRMEWDSETQKKVLDDGEMPPDDNAEDNEDGDLYTPEAIRKREENKDILAVYTPGYTFGCVSYLFPKLKLCCSGFTIPVEQSRPNANIAGMSNAGPAMDYRGYITTNSGGISKQIESSRFMINTYGDRFSAILPSKGPPVSMGHLSTVERQRLLHDMLDEFAELGKVYESMGII